MNESSYKELMHHGKSGKDIAKIYFCAHPDDRELHFNNVYNALSAEIECSLWYDGDPYNDNDKKRRDFELEQMNLFVIPVTKRLLTEENRAVSEELPFAREKGIPVLPVVVEKIDDKKFDELFSSIFGNMQYLVFNQSDPTAISFKDKLKNYLASVLVSPELSERIKNSFDGYIFLSYRKKDREHIIPIMKTIHQNEGLHDIAVWYDEFLTPGEDFSNNIEKNLKKSNIFMLAVTPNLLENGNYVMTTEYPFAVKSQKPIVAVEMIKTNREELDKHFESLPACIPFSGSEVICAQLKSKLALERVERDKKSELEHKYLIGLAYFSGIDLEIDKERALDLLEEAADEGYLEAMERLSDFYREGIGIRNTDARERQKKYVLHCKERYEREGTEKSALRFADALEAMGNLEDSLIKFGPMDPTMLGHHPVPEACTLAIALLERTNEKYKTPKTKRKLIATYDSICERYTITRRNGMVIEYGLRSIALLEEMASYNYDVELYKNISERYLSLSREILTNAETALEYQQKAMIFYNKAKGKDRSPETLNGYIDIFNSMALGLLHRFYDRYNDGKQIVERIFALREELFEKEPTKQNALTLCKEYLKYSDYIVDYPPGFQIFEAEKRLEFCNRAEQLMKEVYGKEDPVESDHFDLFLQLMKHTAMAYEEAGNGERAAEYYLKYILKLENPPVCINHEAFCRDKAIVYLSLSHVLASLGFGERAAKCALTAVSLGTLKFKNYRDFMLEYVEKNDADTLDAFVSSGFDHYAKLVENDTSTMLSRYADNSRSEFANICYSAFEICLKSGRIDAALKYLHTCINFCRPLAEGRDNRQNALFLFRALARLGDLYLRFENRVEAEKSFLECSAVGNSIGDDELLLDDLRILVSVFSVLASFAEKEGDLERAERYYTFALKRRYRIFLINNDKNELNEGIAPLSAIYKKQGNKLFVIKKTFALTKQIKQWGEE